MTCSSLAETTLRLVPATVPKAPHLTLMKPLPVTVTLVPPADGPAFGDTDDSTGAAAVAGNVIVYPVFPGDRRRAGGGDDPQIYCLRPVGRNTDPDLPG
jgi:hypothetical protein